MKIFHTMFLIIVSVLIVSCSEAQTKSEVAIDGKGGVLEKVNTEEFYDISRMDGIQIIDVRTTGEVAEGKIPGARNIDVMQWDLFVKEVESLDKSRPVL
ncbi:MAG TPA: rhodanese-like domain-containing protein, partial [Cryomorphaceae bacterium]|nr:rhodanese-like domain-containing protein [Cryomorphaceae bacterium]